MSASGLQNLLFRGDYNPLRSFHVEIQYIHGKKLPFRIKINIRSDMLSPRNGFFCEIILVGKQISPRRRLIVNELLKSPIQRVIIPGDQAAVHLEGTWEKGEGGVDMGKIGIGITLCDRLFFQHAG